MLQWPDKDPNEVLDYQIDWSARLGSDTISTSTWTVPSGITQTTSSSTSTTTTIWLSGGTTGTKYTLTNEITTTGGRTMDESVRIRLVDK